MAGRAFIVGAGIAWWFSSSQAAQNLVTRDPYNRGKDGPLTLQHRMPKFLNDWQPFYDPKLARQVPNADDLRSIESNYRSLERLKYSQSHPLFNPFYAKNTRAVQPQGTGIDGT